MKRNGVTLLLPVLLALGACANITHPAAGPSPSRAPVATTPTTQSAPTGDQGKPTPALTDAKGAVAIVKARVTGVTPRLLPTALPAGMEVTVESAGPGGYSVEYTDDLHTHTIVIATGSPMGVNGPHQSMRSMQFRGQDAQYQVFDTTAPASRRVLYWMEPGTQVVGAATSNHVGYYFSATGFTEQEFFQLANSLQPV